MRTLWKRRAAGLALSICLLQPVTVLGQAPEGTGPHEDTGREGSKPEQADGHGGGMPAWLKLGGEVRGRAESDNPLDPDGGGRFYLSRFRLNVQVQPSPRVRFVVQGQDARAFGQGRSKGRESLRNTFDLRQAYVDLGDAETGWQVRTGRQELSLGDERLLGADNYWDAFGQAFDAVLLGYAGPRFRADAFAGFRVEPGWRRLDGFDSASRIAGIRVQRKTRGSDVVEPYFLWKRGGDTVDLEEHPGHRDVLTAGVRAKGNLPHAADYNVEAAVQRGHLVDEPVSAWAGHWDC